MWHFRGGKFVAGITIPTALPIAFIS